jgi:hypothetical protein
MKFENKYELSDAVTSGRLETFFAKDLASGERVLVHIFEAPEKKPNQPTVLWVLESFRNIAPEPPGLVVETGRYGGTTYAYLVTKLPDEAVLQGWKQSYESSAAKTLAIATPSDDTSSPPARETTPSGEFTAIFSGGASRVNPPSDAALPKKADLDEVKPSPDPTAPRQKPSDFTGQFFSGSHPTLQPPVTQASAKSTGEAVVPQNREGPPTSPEIRELTKTAITETLKQVPSSGVPAAKSAPPPEPGSFTALFRSDFKSESTATSGSLDAPPKLDDARPGDFTDFFRGPFDGERPAQTPDILPKATDTPQRNGPGEFTMVFGAGKGIPFAPGPSQEPFRDVLLEPGPFTKLSPASSQTAVPTAANTSLNAWEPTAPKTEIPAPPKEPTWTPPAPVQAKPSFTASIEPIIPKPTVSRTLPEAEPALPEGATRVFSTPAVRPGSSLPPPPAGPSEFTRIISGGMGSPTPPNEPPNVGGSQTPGGGLPGLKAPAAPAAPKIAAPPPPKFTPPAPKAPQVEVKPPKPKASYLPLVIILNVLLFFAILLIVYFAIKR